MDNQELKAIVQQMATEDGRKVADELAQEKSAHEKTRHDLESRIAQLLVNSSKQ